MHGYTVRPAKVEDMGAVVNITNYYIRNSTCIMKEVEESREEREQWLLMHSGQYPMVVAEDGEGVVGWASLYEFSDRSAYRYTAHDSVYVRQDLRYRGIGKLLLTDLIARSRKLGYHSIVAVIGAEQTPSLRLHESLGFRQVAHYEQVGFKFGRWIDVKHLQLMLQSSEVPRGSSMSVGEVTF
jgi:L-amino acid N-acyltransferase YncA